MTTSAPRTHPLTESHHPTERPTVGLQTRRPEAIAAYALLDHRTRARALRRDLAPAGRYLEVEDDQDTRLIPLDRAVTHIGRGLTADIRLEDCHASRRHAIIAQRGDGARVLDDRSSNGTFVNGRAVAVGYLNDGDVLRIGRAVFRFVEIGPQRATPPLRRIPLPVRARPAPFSPQAA
jgi:pSer/pThr/pTyr-binding forkhead associated (FHA) protein